jgi:Ca2+-transporting ATPase
VWGSLALCAALLVVPVYVAPIAHLLHLVTPDLAMWAIVLTMSLAPLLAVQASARVAARIFGRRGPEAST